MIIDELRSCPVRPLSKKLRTYQLIGEPNPSHLRYLRARYDYRFDRIDQFLRLYHLLSQVGCPPNGALELEYSPDADTNADGLSLSTTRRLRVTKRSVYETGGAWSFHLYLRFNVDDSDLEERVEPIRKHLEFKRAALDPSKNRYGPLQRTCRWRYHFYDVKVPS